MVIFIKTFLKNFCYQGKRETVEQLVNRAGAEEKDLRTLTRMFWKFTGSFPGQYHLLQSEFESCLTKSTFVL